MPEQKPQHYISFGSGVRLMSEEWYLEATGHQFTKVGFRKFCECLGVPMIEIGASRYVDMVRFEIALSSVLRIGEPNFFSPGCETLRNQSVNVPQEQRVADQEKLVRNYRALAAELLLSKKVNGIQLTRTTRKSLGDAARRMADSALQLLPARAQQELRDKALREAAKDA